jgi:hypothetical protein
LFIALLLVCGYTQRDEDSVHNLQYYLYFQASTGGLEWISTGKERQGILDSHLKVFLQGYSPSFTISYMQKKSKAHHQRTESAGFKKVL